MTCTEQDEGGVRRGNLLIPALLILLVLLTRAPLTSRYLFHLDSGHFALAMEHFDISVHQPHPPGYFLYVFLARAVDRFVREANTSLIIISIAFSAGATVATYFAGLRIFNRNTGLVAALLAVVSPTLWFHGEVALSYPCEAFFSAVAGLLCWNAQRGDKNAIYLLAAVIAAAAGFRQSAGMFLFPLLICGAACAGPRKTVGALLILAIVGGCWFLPMLYLSGGFSSYRLAMAELLAFNTGRYTVFEGGLPRLLSNVKVFADFVGGALGSSVVPLLAVPHIAWRSNLPGSPNRQKIILFLCWLLPATTFYLLVFIHPANQGYILILLPPLLLLGARGVTLLAESTGKRMLVPITLLLTAINAVLFLWGSSFRMSLPVLREHDARMARLLTTLAGQDPATAVLLVDEYVYFSYRHLMFYLPRHLVYQASVRFTRDGVRRKIFGGRDRQTTRTDGVAIPPGTSRFSAVLLRPEEKSRARGIDGLALVNATDGIVVASGPVNLLQRLYPEIPCYPRGR